MARRELFLWEPTVSPHKLPLYRALVQSGRFSRVVYVAESDLSEERRKQGWAADLDGSDEIITSPSEDQVRELVCGSPVDSIHIFSGMRRVPCIVTGLKACIENERNFGLMHEPRVFNSPLGPVRLAQSFLQERPLRRHAKFVLAIGAHGPGWFRLSGYRKDRIFPFAYFIEGRQLDHRQAASAKTIVGFLGRLEPQKGLNLLLTAAPDFPEGFKLRVAGAGSLAQRAQDAVTANPEKVEFLGTLEMRQVPEYLASLDLLVLPSTTRDDGWGVVVSEALMAGIPVLVSEAAGSSMCVATPSILGESIPAKSSRAIVKAIDTISTRGIFSPELREKRNRWAVQNLSAAHGAEYLISVVEYALAAGKAPAEFLSTAPALA